ncbi:carbohydrate esterase family 1 protein [Piromyces sp. E2]|nr:carbohydrate esterase family 1 protein [Piromyces sp. E2]|eukprot:OUM69810.1 carbohydrate esterase family 1 protein [Piromyces sp. E2]
MKINSILSVIALSLIAEVSAKCFAEEFGKPCCTNTKDVVSIDNNGKWVQKPVTRSFIESRSNKNWKKNYMDKVAIEEFCPADLVEKKEGIKYPIREDLVYYSTTTESERPLVVLVPPNNNPKKKYPVLYLLHGIMTDGAWMVQDNFGTIAIPGNLMSQKKAKEMFIVLPNQYAPAKGTEVEPALTQAYYDGYNNFINDLINDIMPFMKKHYSIKTGRENTALCGYSFGGRNTLNISLRRSDLFGYVGIFSPAPGIVDGDDIFTGHFDGLFKENEVVFKNPPILTMMSCGTNDTIVFDTPKIYHQILVKNNQKHIWYEISGADHADDAAFTSPYHNFLSSVFGQLKEKGNGKQKTKTTKTKKTKTTKTKKTKTTKSKKAKTTKTKKNKN